MIMKELCDVKGGDAERKCKTDMEKLKGSDYENNQKERESEETI